MSKKPLQNRLDNLFKQIQTAAPVESQPPSAPAAGWYWECTPDGIYLACSPEVQECLGIAPEAFAGQPVDQFALHADSAAALQSAFRKAQSPREAEVTFLRADGQPVAARVSILTETGKNGHESRWQGFVQLLPNAKPPTPHVEPRAPEKAQKMATGPLSSSGVAAEAGSFRPSNVVWTKTGIQSLSQNSVVAHSGENEPSVIAAPFRMRERGAGILEIVDDTASRVWSEDDRQLVQEVANQLALALENAELYQTVQQELSERIRAEQEIRTRNQDLATLNQAGQQLSRLTSPQEIYNLVGAIVSQMMACSHLTITQFDSARRTVSYPVALIDGERQELPTQPLGNDLAGYIFWTKKPLLIGHNMEAALVDLGITLPERMPLSLLAIPMLAGDRPAGSLILHDYDKEDAYTAIHVELLSTLTSQATTALENANLFQEIRAALAAIENRERYQANVALVAATLSKYGSKSLPEVLASLGEAAQPSRVYFAQAVESGGQCTWHIDHEWVCPNCKRSAAGYFSQDDLPFVLEQIRETGWIARQIPELPFPDRHFFAERDAQSILVLHVPGRGQFPNLIVFEQTDAAREWQPDEIRVLQIATDALSNTILRENLLKQVQVSLHETENLYNLSHNLALAGEPAEMLAAVASGLQAAAIDRAALVSLEWDNHGNVTATNTAATWVRPGAQVAVHSEYPLETYASLLLRQSPVYYEDTSAGQMEKDLAAVFAQEGVQSLGVLPLWAGKRQIGVLLLQAAEKHAFSEQVRRTVQPLADQLGTSLDNMRLFQETQSALSETGQMYQVSEAIAQAKTAEDLVMIVARHLMPVGTDRVTLATISYTSEGEPAEVVLIGHYDHDHEYQRVGIRYRAALLPFFTSMKNEPLVVPDVRAYPVDDTTRGILLSSGVTGSCIIPLVASGRVIGIIATSARRQIIFKPEEVRRLQASASGIAVSLEKQRLLIEAQRRALELQTAAEIARDTTSTLSLDQLLESIVYTLRDRFNFYHVSLFLLDPNRRWAVIRESTGEAGQEMKQRGHKLAVGSRSVVGSVIATGEPLIISDTAKSPLHFPNPLLPDTRAEMGIPLKLGTQVIGALDLQSNQANAFNQDDLSVLQILADQIAIAIENARAYEVSQKAVEEMREVDRMKSQFLANMSHELRTPLNSIIGFSRVILKGIDGPINETQSQDLNAIYNSGQHLLNLINDILDLSKIEAGKMELSFSEVNLADMANSVMSTATGLLKGKTVRLNQNIGPDMPLVRADNTRVRQVLLNFISNAAKFTDDGSITVEAELVTAPSGKREVMITVTDTGAGIAAEDTHKLFQPFSQVDDSPTRKTGGTGLGLSICRSLIDMHGGRIGLLRSDVGVGSTFFFTLPLMEAEPEPEPEIVPGDRVILAIDDDAQVISLYERYLKPHGYVVTALTDPKQAVQRAKELQPAAITVDIMMPERDGWQVMRDLKNDPETRSIPVIICSILEEEEKGINLGAADYLVKPFAQDDLINAIDRLNHSGDIHNVLIVDDSPEDTRLVQKMLEDSGKFQVSTAQGGVEGWNSLLEKRPDIIVLDLFMPGLNGFDLLERLHSDVELCTIPVIILTGADLTKEQQKQLSDFGQQLLAKGRLSEKDLLASLETSLRKYHLIGD